MLGINAMFGGEGTFAITKLKYSCKMHLFTVLHFDGKDIL